MTTDETTFEYYDKVVSIVLLLVSDIENSYEDNKKLYRYSVFINSFLGLVGVENENKEKKNEILKTKINEIKEAKQDIFYTERKGEGQDTKNDGNEKPKEDEEEETRQRRELDIDSISKQVNFKNYFFLIFLDW